MATVEQERLRLLAVNALDVLARHAEVAQDFGGMAIYARRQIEIDPLGEGAHEQLMRALGAGGPTLGGSGSFRQLCASAA